MDSVKHPGSRSTASTLEKFIKGFANVTRSSDKKRYWIKIEGVNEQGEILASAYCLDKVNEKDIHWTVEENFKGIPFGVEGINMYDRGGDYEMFGSFLLKTGMYLGLSEEEYLIQTYTEPDHSGKPRDGVRPIENRFYAPSFEGVPFRISDSFDRILKAETL
jgi:hypothetical protein